MDNLQIVFAMASLILGVGQVVGLMILARVGRAEKQTDKLTEAQSADGRLLAVLEALAARQGVRGDRVEEKAYASAEAVAALVQRVANVERMSHDCDELKSKVAVLDDWKERNSRRWDQAIEDIAAMKRDIKTLFEQMPGMVVAELIEKLKPRMASPSPGSAPGR